MVILVELLRKLICIICDKSRRMSRTGLSHLRRECIEYLYDTYFLRCKGGIGLEYVGSMCHALLIRLAED